MANYVKFVRGSKAAWDLMSDSNKDINTLYFIADQGDTTGQLFLGSKLISGGTVSSATSLSNLQDILLSEEITDNSILVYNLTEEKWVNKSFLDIFIEMNMTFDGASETQDGLEGLVPAPKAGEQGLFLRGDGLWADPIASIQKQLDDLINGDVDLTIREIATEEVLKIVDNAPESFDTLKEIATWIETNKDVADITGLENRVSTVEGKITSLEELLNGTEGSTGIETRLQAVESTIITMGETLGNYADDIAEVKQAIEWHELDA